MTDRLGNLLNIGDRCVCYNTMKTGSSTTRLVQYEAEIICFTKKNIRVKCVSCWYSYRIGDEFLCGTDNIFKLRGDVAEVRHGRWVYGEDDNIQCSICGHDAYTEGDYRQVKTNYCPNCGARMDKEDEYEAD